MRPPRDPGDGEGAAARHGRRHGRLSRRATAAADGEGDLVGRHADAGVVRGAHAHGRCTGTHRRGQARGEADVAVEQVRCARRRSRLKNVGRRRGARPRWCPRARFTVVPDTDPLSVGAPGDAPEDGGVVTIAHERGPVGIVVMTPRVAVSMTTRLSPTCPRRHECCPAERQRPRRRDCGRAL